MFRGNATSRKSRVESVMPSNRDSIGSWLDVLISMLSLPESERLQVRDELEDHLRSRVDDLLITGTDEQEAVRIAVAELGETAELAKVITHAHTRAHPRRRVMNAAMILVAITGLTYGGLSWIGSPVVHGGSADDGGIEPAALIQEGGEAGVGAAEQAEDRVVFAIQEAGFVDAFGEIAESFGLVPSLSATMLKRYNNHNPMVSLAGEYTLSQAMDRLLVFDPYGVQSNAYYIDEGRIVITDPMVVIRRETMVKTYSIGWADTKTASQILGTLYDVIKNGRYSQFYNAGRIGDQLVINARSQAHEQIEVILAESKAAFEALALKEKDDHDQAVGRIQAEFNRVRGHLLATKAQLGTLQIELASLQSVGPDDQSNPEFSGQVLALTQRAHNLMFEIDEIEERYFYLRTRLLESEYADLFDGIE